MHASHRQAVAYVRRLALVAAMMLLAAACNGSSDPASEGGEQEFVIGHAAAITGELAPYDSPDGVQCRVDQLNDEGGILGASVEVLVQDSKSDPVVSTTVTQEMLDAGASVIMGTGTEDNLIPMAELTEPSDIPVISVGSTQPQFPLASPANGFLTAYGDNLQAAAIAEYAIEQGHQTAYLLLSPDVGSYSLASPRWFGETFEELGGRIVGDDNYSAGLSDYTPQVARIASLEETPDVIFGAFLVPDAGVFARQLKQAGVDAPFYGMDGFDDPSLIDVARDAADGLTFVTHGFESDGSRLQEFYDDCRERGYEIQNVFFGLGGESVELVKAAAEEAESLEPVDIMAALKDLEDVQGIVSESITFRDQRGIPLKEVAIVQVVDGEFELIDRLVPRYVPDPS